MSAQPRHRQQADGIASAWIAGTSSRWASKNGWAGPGQEERDLAVAELVECATVKGEVRVDLLTEQAGILRGVGRSGQLTAPLAERRSELILAAIAAAGDQVDEAVLEEWAAEGLKRATQRSGLDRG